MRQGLEQRSWRNDAYWLVPLWLDQVVLFTIEDHLHRSGKAHSGLNPPIL